MAFDWRGAGGWGVGLLWAIVALALALLFLAAPAEADAQRIVRINYVIVFGIGLSVGVTEMMARYPDAPFRPMLSVPGLIYFLLNGGAAALAYYLIRTFAVPAEAATQPAGADATDVYHVLLAGLGAMAFFRSGFFTMRLGDRDDVAIGPNLVLQIMLRALDRAYDRDRAEPRSALVAEIMGGVSFQNAKNALPLICFNLMQNITEEEREAMGAKVSDLAGHSDMTDEARVLNLGLSLMNLVGEKTLRCAVEVLGPTVQGFRAVDPDMLLKLAAVPATRAIETLPIVCNELCHNSVSVADPARLVDSIVQLSLPDENKAILVLYKVIRKYGALTVGVALEAIA